MASLRIAGFPVPAFHHFDGIPRSRAKASASSRWFRARLAESDIHGAHLGAERLMRGEGEKSGVHAAGVGDDEATAASEDLAQAVAFSSSVGAVFRISIILEKSLSYPAKTAAPAS